MACCGGTAVVAVEDVNKTQSIEIDRQLNLESKDFHASKRVLSLGCGEVGKSTFFTSLAIKHAQRVGHPERVKYIRTLQGNAIETIKLLIAQAETLNVELPKQHDKDKEELMNLARSQSREILSMQHAEMIDRLWSTDEIQRVFAWKNDEARGFYLPDQAEYYMKNVIRFANFVQPSPSDPSDTVYEPDTVPTDEDILNSRHRTTGIIHLPMRMADPDGGVDTRDTKDSKQGREWVLVDVGGQRSERRKWVGAFENFDAILFFVDVSGIDKIIFESTTQNSIIEAFETFDQMLKLFAPLFENGPGIPLLLVFNKIDLLEKKIKAGVDIARCLNPHLRRHARTLAETKTKTSSVTKMSPSTPTTKTGTPSSGPTKLESFGSSTRTSPPPAFDRAKSRVASPVLASASAESKPLPLFNGSNTIHSYCDYLLEIFQTKSQGYKLKWPLLSYHMLCATNITQVSRFFEQVRRRVLNTGSAERILSKKKGS